MIKIFIFSSILSIINGELKLNTRKNILDMMILFGYSSFVDSYIRLFCTWKFLIESCYNDDDDDDDDDDDLYLMMMMEIRGVVISFDFFVFEKWKTMKKIKNFKPICSLSESSPLWPSPPFIELSFENSNKDRYSP